MHLTRTTIKIPIEYLPTTKTRMPQFLVPLQEYLLDHITEEGLFRANGDKTKVLKLNEMLSQHVPQWPEHTSPNDAASFLKLWLRELPTPLITPSIVSTYYTSDIKTTTKDILFHLPLVTRKCVAVVFGIMDELVKNEEKNKMSFSNMLTCIVPSLTQNMKDIPAGFPFKAFFLQSVSLLNDTKTDFFLATPDSALALIKPGGRKAKTCMTVRQRKLIGAASSIADAEDVVKKGSMII